MSEKELRKMIDHASAFCERHFAAKGEIAPMWHFINAKGEQFIEPHPPFDKDTSMALIRALFDLNDVVRYIYMGEAWTLDRMIKTDEMDEIRRTGLASHPDRCEIVQLQGEDSECGQLMGQRKIIRPKAGRPYLAPLQMTTDLPFIPTGAHVESSGRMVGVLPVQGTRQ